MAADHSTWDSRGLSDVYRRLLEGRVGFVVVGGQAINLWAEHYCMAGEPPGAAWDQLQPFASGDLDLFGDLDVVNAAEPALGVEAERRPTNLEKVWTPAVGTFYLPTEAGRELTIHVLHTVNGLSSNDIEETAQVLSWDGMKVRVLHPILCLEAKLANLVRFPQDRPGLERQDYKHARLAALVICANLREGIIKEIVRPVTDLVERIMRTAGRQEGLVAWSQFGLKIEESVPVDALHAAAQAGNAHAKNFLEMRWSQLQTMLETKRVRKAESLRLEGGKLQPADPLFVFSEPKSGRRR